MANGEDTNINPLAGQGTAELQAQDPRLRGQVSDPQLRQNMASIDLGFAQAGAMFGGDEATAAAYRQYGANITGVMQQRWFQKEFESFEGQYLQPYTDKLRSIDSSLTEKFGQIDNGTVVGPDGSMMPIDPNSVQAARLKSNLLAAHTGEMSKATDDLLHATTKYGTGNPFIQARIQGIMEAHTQQIAMLTNPEQLIAGERGMGEVAMAPIARKKAEAEAYEARERGALLARTDPNIRSESGAEWERISGDPEQYMTAYGPTATASRLMSTTGAKSWMASDYDAAVAGIRKEMMDKAKTDKGFAKSVGYDDKGVLIEPERFEAELGRRGSQAMARSAAEFAKRMGSSELIEELKRRPQVAQYLGEEEEAPAEKPYKVPGILPDAEVEQLSDVFAKNTIAILEEKASSGEIKSKDEMIAEAKRMIQEELQHANNPGARKQARELGQEILNKIGRTWKDSDVFRKAFGEPDLGDIAGAAWKGTKGLLP